MEVPTAGSATWACKSKHGLWDRIRIEKRNKSIVASMNATDEHHDIDHAQSSEYHRG